MASVSATFLEPDEYLTTRWGNILSATCFAASMVVNALVTGLIVFKIFKVFREVKRNTTSDERSLGVTGGNKLRSVIFAIIESGMALLAIQLARLVIVAPGVTTFAEEDVSLVMCSMHPMLNVIISSVIASLYFIDDVKLARV